MLRRDPRLLGRVQEQQWRDKKMKEERRGIDVEKLGGEGAAELAVLANTGDTAAEASGAGTAKRGRGRKRKPQDDGGTPAKRVHA